MDNTIRGLSTYSGVPGARHTVAPEEAPRDAYLPESSPPQEEEPRKKRHLLRKLMAGTALTLTAAGAAGVGGSYLAAHAPICQDAQAVVAVTENGLCVNQEIGLAGAHSWRILAGLPSLPNALDSLSDHHNQVHRPQGEQPPPAPLMQDGELTAVTFNLHHERSPDAEGARDQTGDIVTALRDQKADVYLLQEVSPDHVDDLVEGTGMVGYFSQTSLTQGNLILVHPQLPVQADSSQMLLHGAEGAGEALGNLKDWVTQGGAYEPRSLQTVEVGLPNGREAVLWNTHMPTHEYSEQQREDSRDMVMRALDRHSEPGQLVVGGGDINAGEDGSLANLLRQDGHEVHFYHIDAINARGHRGEVEFEGFHLNDSHGYHLSDHPMARAKIPV